ncbi:MAG TPA: hypothetical protein VNM91_06365, partial [Dehalococcoidia bacterium]|nr:hypothetical protein [Dehalococcoidia bacterium]
MIGAARTSTLIIVLIAALAAACSNDAATTPDSSRTPVAAADTPAPAPTTVPPPPRPADFTLFGAVIADYLNAEPAAAAPNDCLRALFEAWAMPYVTNRTCLVADTDDDAGAEIAVAVVDVPPPAQGLPVRMQVIVLDRTSGAYEVTFRSATAEDPVAIPEEYAKGIVAGGDLNGDGAGELAYTFHACGSSTCFNSVHIAGGRGGEYARFTPAEGIVMSFADFHFEDRDGDGAQELVITGGAVGSIGAGPARERTEVWRWDGAAYVLAATTQAAPEYLYHAILDADALLSERKFAEAAAAYVAAAEDPDLLIWHERATKPELEELRAYAYFRAALATLAGGGDAAQAAGHLDAAVAENAPLHSPLAAAFRDSF